MAQRRTMEELLFLHPNLSINTITKNQPDKWERVAFSVDVTDQKVVHKIGLELKTGGKAFIGEFAIYKIRPEPSHYGWNFFNFFGRSWLLK